MLKAGRRALRRNLENGMKVWKPSWPDAAIDGATAFTLYDTYGFPPT
jgi:alanyl-tRNA synthetase